MCVDPENVHLFNVESGRQQSSLVEAIVFTLTHSAGILLRQVMVEVKYIAIQISNGELPQTPWLVCNIFDNIGTRFC